MARKRGRSDVERLKRSKRGKAVTLHINEGEVKSVLSMALAMEAVETISRRQAAGEVLVHARRRFELPGGAFFHHMAAADLTEKLVASKQYTYAGGKLKFVVSLFSTESGDLLALIEADVMGQMRTGAASGVATKFLARADARSAANIGTGWQAQTQLEAIVAVRKLKRVRVHGREAERREKFAKE